MKIVHITESYGGGITTAINSYVINSIEHHHYLIACTRPNDQTGEESSNIFVNSFILKRHFLSIVKLRKILTTINPDVIHIHSSFAGAICRILPFVPKEISIYSPHGYSFLRQGSKTKTYFYFLIEKLLANKVAAIASCGKFEAKISRKLTKNSHQITLHNICDELTYFERKGKSSDKLKVGMVGRLSPQKGVSFFCDVVREVGSDVEFVWIGGGDPILTDRVEECGAFVTGWLTRKQVLEQLATLDYYFHTAAWEGFPISVLEAAKLNIPLVLRDIGPFTAESLFVSKDVAAAVETFKKLLSEDLETKTKAVENYKILKISHNKKNLKKSLKQLYSLFE